MRLISLAAIALLALSASTADAKPFDKLKEDLKESGWNPKKKVVDDGLADTEGVTSPLHQAHMGEIVFTTTPIPDGGPTADQLVDAAALGPDLYIQAFMPDSMFNATVKDPEREPSFNMSAQLDVRVDGEECQAIFGRGDEQREWRLHKTTLSSALVARDGGDLPDAFGACVAKLQSSLSPGVHELELELRARSSKPRTGVTEPLASGRLALTVTDASFDPSYRSLCKMPLATHSSASIERDFRKRMGAGARDVHLVSRDWTVSYHDLTGAILSRYYLAAVGVAEDDGTCSYATHAFTQQYTGSGFADTMQVYKETKGQGRTPCGCLGD